MRKVEQKILFYKGQSLSIGKNFMSQYVMQNNIDEKFNATILQESKLEDIQKIEKFLNDQNVESNDNQALVFMKNHDFY
jgi:hypothetical protein